MEGNAERQRRTVNHRKRSGLSRERASAQCQRSYRKERGERAEDEGRKAENCRRTEAPSHIGAWDLDLLWSLELGFGVSA
jgi:hypothetical protein